MRRSVFIVVGVVAIAAVVLAGGWAVSSMPGESYDGSAAPLDAREERYRARLERDVAMLASEIGERNVYRPDALERAALHLEGELRDAGLAPARQTYVVDAVPCHNIEVELRGTRLPEEIIVVGGHYDSVIGSPGANDNATGAAATVALARAFAGRHAARTVRFVLFVNEEPPFFQTGQMGSYVYAARSSARGEKVAAMLSLETMGYYSDEEGSQRYPFPLNLAYPTTGNFIGFAGNMASRGLVERVVGLFREHASFPSEGATVPDEIQGIGWSDHWSFWQFGYEALMITDTAPFRYEHYHEPTDTPDRIDYVRLARVVAGIEKVITALADAP
jgi:hypothetical protein